jgi:hypothetical protein
MMLPKISPKVFYPVLMALAAAAALYLLTGDQSFLVTILISLAGGGIGIAASPAPGVKQAEVEQVAAGFAEIVPIAKLEPSEAELQGTVEKPGPPQPPDGGKPTRHG